MYLNFDETEGPNPIANADHSTHVLADSAGALINFPTNYTYHGLQLTPLGSTTNIFTLDTSADGIYGPLPSFNINTTLVLEVPIDRPDPSAVGSLTISAARGSFTVFSLYTYAFTCGTIQGSQSRKLTQGFCPGAEVEIFGTLAGARVDACEVGTISFTPFNSPQYVVFAPGCVVDTLQFIPTNVQDLAIDNIVTCAATADSSLTLAA